MAALVDIWNMALAFTGHSEQVSDPNTETTNAANLCRSFYAVSLDEILSAHDWNFARKRGQLSLLTSTVTNWQYAYGYPGDCVKVRSLVPAGVRYPLPEDRIAYEVGNLDDNLAIFTDLDQAEAIYTSRVHNPNLMPSDFVTALAYLLASKIAIPLTGKMEGAANARNAYMTTMSSARASNLNEGEIAPDMPECEFVSVRGVSFGDVTGAFPGRR